jgi:sec-independent protein translocase protein TatA
MTVPVFAMLQTPEIIGLLVLALILFGAKKLPELARGLGRGIKEFKKATRDVTDELNSAMDFDRPSSSSRRQQYPSYSGQDSNESNPGYSYGDYASPEPGSTDPAASESNPATDSPAPDSPTADDSGRVESTEPADVTAPSRAGKPD